MSIRNCSRCGKVYNSAHQSLCPECVEADEVEFQAVREFIKDNPKVSLDVVSEATGVSEDRLLEYLRDGRLESAELSGPVLECKRCGKPIQRGEYCVLCQSEISQTFGNTLTKKKPQESRNTIKHGLYGPSYRQKK